MPRNLVIAPDAAAIATLLDAWGWLLPCDIRPLMFSAIGDMFYEDGAGTVFWLDTGRGEITRIADNTAEFRALMETEEAEYWLLPKLIAEAVAAGKVLAPGQCYGFAILPVFAEGEYAADNLAALPAWEVYGLSGDIHRQIRDMPDGGKVRIRVTE